MTPDREQIRRDAPMVAVLPLDVWTRLIFAAQESDDWKLRTLIEQAVAGAKIIPGKGLLRP